MIWLLVGGFWLLCSVIAYATTLAYFTREYPGLEEPAGVRFALFMALLMALFGPVGLTVAFIMGDCWKHGLRWWWR